jgi:hypothetical protein
MPAKIRSLAVAALLALAAATLSACGSSSSASSDTPDPAAARAAAQKIIRQALAVNPKADSGRVGMTIDLDIAGISRLKGPIQVTVNGRYNLPQGASVPDFDFDVGVSVENHILGGSFVLVDGKSYIELGNVGYEVPAAITRVLMAPAADANNGLTKTAAMFHIHPENWEVGAQLTGESTVAGERVQELRADISPKRAFRDLARFVHFLSLLRVPQALALPNELTPELQAALVRSVTVAKGAVWIGSSDHVLRKAHLEGKGVVAPRDRELLYGATNATLGADVNITDVGVPQEISAPKQLDSYSSLQLTMTALGEAVRREVRAAKREAHAAAAR